MHLSHSGYNTFTHSGFLILDPVVAEPSNENILPFSTLNDTSESTVCFPNVFDMFSKLRKPAMLFFSFCHIKPVLNSKEIKKELPSRRIAFKL